jgi:isochorismate synthase
MLISDDTVGILNGTYQADALWKAAFILGFPAAVWRLPNKGEIKLLISIHDGIQFKKADLEDLSSCFIIHPFENLENDEAMVLEGDLLFTFSDDLEFRQLETKLGEEHPTVKRLIQESDLIAGKTNQGKTEWEGFSTETTSNPDVETHYKETVSQAIRAIREGHIDKVVLSRTKDYPYTEKFDLFKAFQKLNKTYLSAFVSLINLPDRQESWLGASPEKLVGMDAQGVFKTTALAGTQNARTKDGEVIPAKEVRWGQKEIEEQALVSRYIIECFKKIRLREYQEKGPKTSRAGNLYHLRTDFEVNTHEVNFPELGTVMLTLLHPTSAVCGMPKKSALKFINAAENYQRSLYSGYLGPVKIDQESSLFVNLRCMRFKNGTATLFAGAGITEDSDPQKEWDETEMKCETLLRVLI